MVVVDPTDDLATNCDDRRWLRVVGAGPEPAFPLAVSPGDQVRHVTWLEGPNRDLPVAERQHRQILCSRSDAAPPRTTGDAGQTARPAAGDWGHPPIEGLHESKL